MKLGYDKCLLGAAALLLLAAAPAAYANSGQNTVSCSDGSVTYSPTTLWPPNHKLQTITIQYNQPCDDGFCPGPPISVTVNSITETQEPPGNGCGQPSSQQGPDFTGVGNTASSVEPGPATTTVQLRAERCGTEDTDRVYDINVTCNDDGELGNADLLVTVPHNQ